MQVYVWCDSSMMKRVAVAVADSIDQAREMVRHNPRYAGCYLVDEEPRIVLPADRASAYFDD